MSKLVVIGGVAAGMSAASKAKRVDPNMEIVVFEKGNFVSYGACGLPYFVSGLNDDYKKLIARTPEEFQESGIKVKLRHEVLSIDSMEKVVKIRDLDNNREFEESFDKLLIATGASPIKPKIKNADIKNVFTLKTIEDAIEMKEIANKDQVKNVVIVGGGYISMEIAESMVYLNKNVRIIEKNHRMLSNFDEEISEKVEEELKRNHVKMNYGENVEELIGETSVSSVKTDKGTYDADMVIIAIGVIPNTEFLKGSGINLGIKGSVIIDREGMTNIRDIYAAGDCAEIYHKLLEKNVYIALATTANKMGRLIGENVTGSHERFVGTLGSSAIKILDIDVARTGITEAEAKSYGYDYETVFVKANTHPGYYPNSTPLYIKLVYEKKDKRILGVQIVGEKGVALRMDVFAAAIHNNMTTKELGMLDLCYAPPFAGVWDAIHIAANAAK
ncbi:CoA-disulfide reductase [Clostridium algidicarnis]|mgnify:CR=1 FL=1|uniref:CoA-disulfide reductase n=1 Tax=Clostridium algidicarnis TaxID=37659 RepID=A0ABS6C609_9CLOT|nr:CoA-disulfide reductase [Clostridium algidicarnis]MBB6632317.1 CoA-disulfide reductase [Clostridium algidicarnis]MBU3220908.1 CoA-disulfide reductase [Clostridium algidicarnis]